MRWSPTGHIARVAPSTTRAPEIQAAAGSQFDPEVVAGFMAIPELHLISIKRRHPDESAAPALNIDRNRPRISTVIQAIRKYQYCGRALAAKAAKAPNDRDSLAVPPKLDRGRDRTPSLTTPLPQPICSGKRPMDQEVQGARHSGGTPQAQRALLWLASLVCALPTPLSAGPNAIDAQDLTEISLEELGRIRITSVSRKPQQLTKAAAAVFVITADDIRRSGAASIPEALRMAPGVEVARIDSNQWAVGVRGFNGRYANKLLVLIDGRTVYNPFFSGVYWDMHDVPMEQIERIEVIRGPGATMWGVNAVNGVINVITKVGRRYARRRHAERRASAPETVSSTASGTADRRRRGTTASSAATKIAAPCRLRSACRAEWTPRKPRAEGSDSTCPSASETSCTSRASCTAATGATG